MLLRLEGATMAIRPMALSPLSPGRPKSPSLMGHHVAAKYGSLKEDTSVMPLCCANVIEPNPRDTAGPLYATVTVNSSSTPYARSRRMRRPYVPVEVREGSALYEPFTS